LSQIKASATDFPILATARAARMEDRSWAPAVRGNRFPRHHSTVIFEIAHINYGGTHALVFPCRRILNGWMKAETKEQKLMCNPRIGASGYKKSRASVFVVRVFQPSRFCFFFGQKACNQLSSCLIHLIGKQLAEVLNA